MTKTTRGLTAFIVALGLVSGMGLVALAQTPAASIGPTFGGSGSTFVGGVLSAASSINNDLCFTLGTTDTAASPCLRFDTTQTPDTGMLLTGTVSNHWVIAERQDETFDFAHAATTNPTLFIHSAAQSTTQWLSLSHNGTNADLKTGAGNFMVTPISQVVFNPGGSVVALASNMFFELGTSGADGIGTAGNSLMWNTTQTVDTGMLLTGTTNNAWVIAEFQDYTFDFAHAQATDPTLFIHSHNQATTEWLGLTHNGTNGVVSVGAGSLVVPKLVPPVGSKAAPSYGWTGEVDSGLYNYAGGAVIGMSLNGTEIMNWQANDIVMHSGVNLEWAAGASDAVSPDTIFSRSTVATVRVGGASSALGYLLSGQTVTANTGAATPAITASGTVYTNTGDADGSTVTLPNDPTVGTTFTIVATAAQNITVAPSAGETLMFGNTTCGTSFVVGGAATGIGDSATVLAATGGSGAVWITTASAGTPVCTP